MNTLGREPDSGECMSIRLEPPVARLTVRAPNVIYGRTDRPRKGHQVVHRETAKEDIGGEAADRFERRKK
jgi:hypothetical protein